MRSIENLVREYPEKTGAEIIAIQGQDKIQDQKDYDERNKVKLAFVNDINTNGGYYRGRFGVDQHYFYRVFDLVIEDDRVIMKVETLVCFFNNTNDTRQVTRPNYINIERRVKDYEILDQYGLQHKERVTVKEWNAVNDYINNMSEMFWGMIKPV